MGPFDKADHLGSSMDRQAMRCETRSWRNVGRHLANHFELRFVGVRQQCDDQILECDDANLELHQFGIRQRWRRGRLFAAFPTCARTNGQCAALVVPPCEGGLAPPGALFGIWAATSPEGAVGFHARAVCTADSAPNSNACMRSRSASVGQISLSDTVATSVCVWEAGVTGACDPSTRPCASRRSRS